MTSDIELNKKSLKDLRDELVGLEDPQKAEGLKRFFKTGKGQYGEGDVFLGIKVPDSKKIAGKYKSLPEEDIIRLLKSQVHEERLIALFILVFKFSKGDEKPR